MANDDNILEKSGGKTAGDVLRENRVARDLTITDVSQATRIGTAHIRAIEENDTDNLPSRVYAIGFVRTYALYFGLDANYIVQLFKIKTVGRHDPSKLSMESDVDGKPFASWRMLLGCCAFSLLMMVFIAPIFAPSKESLAVTRSGIPDVPEDLKKRIEENAEAMESIAEEEVMNNPVKPQLTEIPKTDAFPR